MRSDGHVFSENEQFRSSPSQFEGFQGRSPFVIPGVEGAQVARHYRLQKSGRQKYILKNKVLQEFMLLRSIEVIGNHNYVIELLL